MRIRSIETIRLAEHRHVIWVQVHTDAGIVGLGETFYAPRSSRRRSTTGSARC